VSVVAALCGCGLDLHGSAPTGAEDGTDATVGEDAGAGEAGFRDPPADGSAADVVPEIDASNRGDAANAPDSGSCITCAGACVQDCNACAVGKYNCRGRCVSSCDSCGDDFVVCLVCADGGPMVRDCSSTQPGGCLDGTYDHCPCAGDDECPEGNQRCTSDSKGVCTACGESQFNHDTCNQGCCCSSGSNTRRCTRNGCS
jgi:hypothetical protein